MDNISVSSAGIRATSDISGYSDVHFRIMKERGIDTSGFKRTMFKEEFFYTYDYIIGMSKLHFDFIKEKFGKEIVLFNEMIGDSRVSVQVGEPESEGFQDQMKELVKDIHSSIPRLIEKIQKQ